MFKLYIFSDSAIPLLVQSHISGWAETKAYLYGAL